MVSCATYIEQLQEDIRLSVFMLLLFFIVPLHFSVHKMS